MHRGRTYGARVLLALMLALVTSTFCLGCASSATSAATGEDVSVESSAQESYATKGAPRGGASGKTGTSGQDLALPEDGTYTSKDEVAWYLHTYGHLPDNYVTKDEAEDAGWKTRGLSLSEACPGMSIGGDRFSNREGRLPSGKYRECDIDYNGRGSRGPKRLVYTTDCSRIYYTDDHYQTFRRLY